MLSISPPCSLLIILSPTPPFIHPLIFPLPVSSAWETLVKGFLKWWLCIDKHGYQVSCQSHSSLYSLQFNVFHHRLNSRLRWESYLLQSATLLWLILLWKLQFSYNFFCNVTSLGIVCIRRGKTIKVLFSFFCYCMAFVHYSCARPFWVNYFGASLFSY